MSALEVNLAPGLLVSMPQLNDPFFGRSVVLMVEHDDEGSFGLIINQESELPIEELLASLDLSWPDSDKRVFSGGPVVPSSGWVLHEAIDGLEVTRDGLEDALENGTTLAINDDLYLSSSVESLRLITEARPAASKFILGYSGWSGGQLAQEMARGSWLHADIQSSLVFDTEPDELWAASLKSIGVDPEAIVQTRGVH